MLPTLRIAVQGGCQHGMGKGNVSRRTEQLLIFDRPLTPGQTYLP
jgi:hypothetical protein